jgi:CheY-like chemotaxis protein
MDWVWEGKRPTKFHILLTFAHRPAIYNSALPLSSQKLITSVRRSRKEMTNRSRILIADDHNLVAELCKRLLEMEFEVVGVVSDGRALVRAAGELKPDVIVLDIAMPVLNGLDAGRQVKEMLPAVKLIYLTMNPDTEVAAEAFRRGASGYLLKTCANNALALDAFFLHWSKYLDEKHRTPKPRH